MNFIRPCLPRTRAIPPSGPEWQHEVKFDGWRIQVHKREHEIAIYTRGGVEISRRLPRLTLDLLRLSARSCILDGELIFCDGRGLADFAALQRAMRRRREHELCIFVFDLLELRGADQRELSLTRRQSKAATLLARSQISALVMSQAFPDGAPVLTVAEEMGLEGIVSKRRASPYRSGSRPEWVKVKTNAWRTVNRDRWRQFQKR